MVAKLERLKTFRNPRRSRSAGAATCGAWVAIVSCAAQHRRHRRSAADERRTGGPLATDPPYLVDYDGTNHPGADTRGTKNKDWGDSYGVTWDDAEQGPDLYRGFIRAAVDHAILPNAAWYCWHASRRQAMLEAVWVELGAFVHQQIIWVKNRAVLTRSFYLWKHEPCLMGWLKGHKPERVSEDYLPSVWSIDTPDGADRPDQRRRRLFLVGYLGDWRPPAAVLFDAKSLRGRPAPRRQTKKDLAGTATGGARSRGGPASTTAP